MIRYALLLPANPVLLVAHCSLKPCLFFRPISFSEFYTTTFFKLKTPLTASPGTLSVELPGHTGQSCEHAYEKGSTDQNCGEGNLSILYISKFWHSQG